MCLRACRILAGERERRGTAQVCRGRRINHLVPAVLVAGNCGGKNVSDNIILYVVDLYPYCTDLLCNKSTSLSNHHDCS